MKNRMDIKGIIILIVIFISFYFISTIVLDKYDYKDRKDFVKKQQEIVDEKLDMEETAKDLVEKQEEIVSILDRFDALCNDISAGLPAEIEARQKQYEYYRDKLLTFKEASL